MMNDAIICDLLSLILDGAAPSTRLALRSTCRSIKQLIDSEFVNITCNCDIRRAIRAGDAISVLHADKKYAAAAFEIAVTEGHAQLSAYLATWHPNPEKYLAYSIILGHMHVYNALIRVANTWRTRAICSDRIYTAALLSANVSLLSSTNGRWINLFSIVDGEHNWSKEKYKSMYYIRAASKCDTIKQTLETTKYAPYFEFKHAVTPDNIMINFYDPIAVNAYMCKNPRAIISSFVFQIQQLLFHRDERIIMLLEAAIWWDRMDVFHDIVTTILRNENSHSCMEIIFMNFINTIIKMPQHTVRLIKAIDIIIQYVPCMAPFYMRILSIHGLYEHINIVCKHVNVHMLARFTCFLGKVDLADPNFCNHTRRALQMNVMQPEKSMQISKLLSTPNIHMYSGKFSK